MFEAVVPHRVHVCIVDINAACYFCSFLDQFIFAKLYRQQTHSDNDTVMIEYVELKCFLATAGADCRIF